MIRIFSILSAITVVMILFAGGGVYWLLQSDVELARQTSTESVVKGMIPTVLSWIFLGIPMLCRRYRTKCLTCGNIFKRTSN